MNDEIGSALGVYFTKLVVPTYTGPCINISNDVNGNTFDIGFDDNGMLDVDELNSRIKSAAARVNIWYDQSGNGNHLTSSGDSRPYVSKTNAISGLRAIIFETKSDYSGATIDQNLAFPAGITGQTNSLTFGAVARFRHSTRDCPIFELSSASGYTAFGVRRQTNIDGLMTTQNGARTTWGGNLKPTLGTEFVMCSIGESTTSNFLSGRTQKDGNSLSAETFTGGKVGSTTNTFMSADGLIANNGGFSTCGMFIKNTSTVTTQYRNAFFSSIRDYEIKPQHSGVLIMDGDSITEGDGGRFYTSYPQQIQDRLAGSARVYNCGVGGGTITSQINNKVGWQTQLYNEYAPFNIVTLMIGTNDLSDNDTAEEIFAGITTYTQSLVATGYEVYLVTVLPRDVLTDGSPKEIQRLALNELIRNSYATAGASGFIDMDDEGTMGEYAYTTNTTYFSDGTHPTPYGYGMVATYIQDYIEPIVKKRLIEYYL
jgi:lysophospholipase L1-like esterase